MAYKYSKGKRKFDDIQFEGDTNTEIDFEDDYIALEAGGNAILVVSGSQVGIGTSNPSALLTLNSVQPKLKFTEGGQNRAEIYINDSDNLKIINRTSNKHMVFEISDGGTLREGLRLRAISSVAGVSTPEVVINDGSESLMDFRVESDNNTHAIYVDGANDKIGIKESSPNSGFHVGTSFSHASRTITQNYTADADDHTIFVNASANSVVTLSLPTASGILGRQYIIKRIDSNLSANVTIDPNSSETIEGSATKVLSDQNSIVIQSDGSNWWIMAEFITPP